MKKCPFAKTVCTDCAYDQRHNGLSVKLRHFRLRHGVKVPLNTYRTKDRGIVSQPHVLMRRLKLIHFLNEIQYMRFVINPWKLDETIRIQTATPCTVPRAAQKWQKRCQFLKHYSRLNIT